MNSISGTVDDVANEIDSSYAGSFAATAEPNLKTFFQSIFSNIEQTTMVTPETPVVTVYDVINNSGMITNV